MGIDPSLYKLICEGLLQIDLILLLPNKLSFNTLEFDCDFPPGECGFDKLDSESIPELFIFVRSNVGDDGS